MTTSLEGLDIYVAFGGGVYPHVEDENLRSGDID